MYTQCPHCLTLFRINSEQLKIAAGKVRCCQCDQTFNALDNLQEHVVRSHPPKQVTPAEITTTEQAAALPEAETSATDGPWLASDPTHAGAITDGETGRELTEDPVPSLFLERNDGLETEPDYFTGNESQMSELLDQDSSSLLNSKDEETLYSTTVGLASRHTTARAEPGKSEEMPGDAVLPSRSIALNDMPAATTYSPDEIFEQEPVRYASIAWGMGSLVLFCLIALQLIWHSRELVIQYPLGQQLLTQTCEITGCEVPQRRDTNKITIEHRDLRIHPEKANALILQLHMTNRAAFDQPLPRLRLSLFDKSEKLINERTFKPAEYLPDATQRDGLMHSSEAVNITMELMDPGKGVTGFKFDFL